MAAPETILPDNFEDITKGLDDVGHQGNEIITQGPEAVPFGEFTDTKAPNDLRVGELATKTVASHGGATEEAFGPDAPYGPIETQPAGPDNGNGNGDNGGNDGNNNH